MEVMSQGSNFSAVSTEFNGVNYSSKKYQIELNIKLLYVKDPKYF